MTEEQMKLLAEAIMFMKPKRRAGYWKPLEDLLEKHTAIWAEEG